eukprot:6988545-Alexandrium_andersonii.AAC.1
MCREQVAAAESESAELSCAPSFLLPIWPKARFDADGANRCQGGALRASQALPILLGGSSDGLLAWPSSPASSCSASS